MTAALTNIKMTGFSQCSQIKLGSSNISKAYLGSTLIWDNSVSESYYAITPVNGCLAFAFTPSANVNLTSVSFYQNNTSTFNILFGIYTLSGSVATKLTSDTTTTGLTVDTANPIVVGSVNYYKYTKTLTTPYALTAGVTYYILLWQRYIGCKTLGITGNTSGSYIDIYEWESGNATVNTAPKTTGVTLKFGVVTS